MRIALCPINPTVGDLAGNAGLVLEAARRAAEAGADLAVFPELCVTGYPPQDLLDRPSFLADADAAVDYLARMAPDGLGLLVGAPVRNETPHGKRLYNSALLLDGGRVADAVSKTLLPTYDVFDEYRYFEPCPERKVMVFRGLRLGVHLCEDMWNNEEQAPYHLYTANPIDELAVLGIDLFVNVSASPFSVGKPAERTRLIRASCREHGVPFVYVNQLGANTELIFDGDSRVHAADGTILWRAAPFQDAFHVWEYAPLSREGTGRSDGSAPHPVPPPAEQGEGEEGRGRTYPALPGGGTERWENEQEPIDQIHDALVLGIRDYVEKTGRGVFEKVLIGLSGGIDSAVTCALAVTALGPERVVGVTMPSKYSSAGSVSDSEALAANLGIAFHDISIRPAVDAFGQMLAPLFAGTEEGVAEENIQARARSVTLMAVSNKFGYLLLTTGNKSEMAVGYATLYGDMSGGLAVLADVFKTEVYALARYINERAGREVIPESTITKPPSAELKPGQVDQDSLPPYDVLDAILEGYVEAHLDTDAIVAAGYDRALVERVIRMVDRNEYKRRQAAPGLRVSPKAFGVGRRLPIVMQRTRIEADGEAEVVEAFAASSVEPQEGPV